jgi:hypothetical protein
MFPRIKSRPLSGASGGSTIKAAAGPNSSGLQSLVSGLESRIAGMSAQLGSVLAESQNTLTEVRSVQQEVNDSYAQFQADMDGLEVRLTELENDLANANFDDTYIRLDGMYAMTGPLRIGGVNDPRAEFKSGTGLSGAGYFDAIVESLKGESKAQVRAVSASSLAGSGLTVQHHDGTNWIKILTATGSQLLYGTNKIWHEGNDGAGSDLDAGKLGGLPASSYLTTAGDLTIDGNWTFDGAVRMANDLNFGPTTTEWTLKRLIANALVLQKAGSGGNDFEFENTGAGFATARLKIAGNVAWHAGNDGSGSGLDADTLDSYEASAFTRKAENATVTGTWTFNNPLTVGDLTVGSYTGGYGLNRSLELRLRSTSGAVVLDATGSSLSFNGSVLEKVGASSTLTLGKAGQSQTIRVGSGGTFSSEDDRWTFAPSGRFIFGPIATDDGSTFFQVEGTSDFSLASTFRGSVTSYEGLILKNAAVSAETAKLELDSSGRLRFSDTDNLSLMDFDTDGVWRVFSRNAAGTVALERLKLTSSADTATLQIKSSNVVVGGTAADELFHVRGTAKADLVKIKPGQTAPGTLLHAGQLKAFSTQTGYSYIGHETNDNTTNYAIRVGDADTVLNAKTQIDFAIGGSVKWRLNSSGYFGAGTLTPTRRAEFLDPNSYQLRLTYSSGYHADIGVGSGGSLELHPTGNIVVRPDGGYMLPYNSYETTIGSDQKKFLGLHVAEIRAETLVARETVATIGGRILVGETTNLAAPLTTVATEVLVRHNAFSENDVLHMEAYKGVGASALTQVEFMRVVSPTTFTPDSGKIYKTETKSLFNPVTGGIESTDVYRYQVVRNLDGTGANPWDSGDAVFDTGTTGDGFIDLYSRFSMRQSAGPGIVMNVRQSSTYNDWGERMAMGNLNGMFYYGQDLFGFAAGKKETTWVSADEQNGFRIMYGNAKRGHWKTDGTIVIGNETAFHSTFNATSLKFWQDASISRLSIEANKVVVGSEAAGNGPHLIATNSALSLKSDASTTRISLLSDGSGYVATSAFRWDTAGNVVIDGSAKIADWSINAQSIASPDGNLSLSSVDNTIIRQVGVGRITLGKQWNGDWVANEFGLSYATGGNWLFRLGTTNTIAGWSFTSSKFTGGNLSLESAGNIYHGTLGAAASRFAFKNDGSGYLGKPTGISWDVNGNLTLTGTLSGVNGTFVGSIVVGSTNKLWLNDGSDGALSIGGTAKASAPFRVTAAGLLTATNAVVTGNVTATTLTATGSGTIGPWTISGTDLSNGQFHLKPSVGLYYGVGVYNNANTSFWLGADGKFSLKDKLTFDGTNLTVNGSGTFAGTINASGGTFTGYVEAGGWRFGANVDGTKDGIWRSAENYWYEAGDWSVGHAVTQVRFNPTGGNAGAGLIEFLSGGVQVFRVDNTGLLIKGSSKFEGDLTGASGTFGPVTIDNTGIYGNNFYIDVNGNIVANGGEFNNVTILSGATFAGALSAATGSFAGSLSAATGTFAGSLSAATGTFTGALSAATGTFSGSLSAASGSFTGSIVVGSSNKLWLNDASDGALSIGGTTKTSAPFRVSAAGALTATNANITGAITATSGSFIGAITATSGSFQNVTFKDGITSQRTVTTTVWNDLGTVQSTVDEPAFAINGATGGMHFAQGQISVGQKGPHEGRTTPDGKQGPYGRHRFEVDGEGVTWAKHLAVVSNPAGDSENSRRGIQMFDHDGSRYGSDPQNYITYIEPPAYVDRSTWEGWTDTQRRDHIYSNRKNKSLYVIQFSNPSQIQGLESKVLTLTMDGDLTVPGRLKFGDSDEVGTPDVGQIRFLTGTERLEMYKSNADGQGGAGWVPLDLGNPGTEGSASYAMDSDKLDGEHGAFYQNADNLNSGTVPDARIASNIVRNTFTPYTNGTGITGFGNLTTSRTISLTGQAAAIHNLGSSGIVARTASNTFAARTIVASGSGLSVSNGNGISGNPTISLVNDLQAIEGLSGTGLAVRTGTDAWTNRSIAVGAVAGLTVGNGDGIGGNPTIDGPQNLRQTATPTFAGAYLTGPTEYQVYGSTTNTHVSKNVVRYKSGSGTVGAIVFVMPKTWSSTMLRLTIRGVDYSSTLGAWEATVFGYNYGSSSVWLNPAVQITGRAPFSTVTLGHDGSKCVLILGTTSTTWQYPEIVIAEVSANYSGNTGWATGWSSYLSTDLSGITGQVTVTAPVRLRGSSLEMDVALNTTADIKVEKSNAWMTLMGTQTTADTQGSGISIGESGTRGSASVHLTYTGDGYGHLGMGSVGTTQTTGMPAYRAMRFYYQNSNVQMPGKLRIGSLTSVNGVTDTLEVDGTVRALGAATFDSTTLTNGSARFDGGLIVDTDGDTNGKRFAVTRSGSLNESLTIGVIDTVAEFRSVQDETDYFGAYRFTQQKGDGATRIPFYAEAKDVLPHIFLGHSGADWKVSINGSESPNATLDVHGTLLVTDKTTLSDTLTISATTDGPITLDKTSGSNWQYINWNHLGARQWYTGRDSSNNFMIYADASDEEAIIDGGSGLTLRSGSFKAWKGMTVGLSGSNASSTFHGDLLPGTAYKHNIGATNNKWLTGHLAELWVSTLVASEERSTVGGRFNVGLATTLAVSLGSGAGDTVITVKHNNLKKDDILHLEARLRLEFMKVGTHATPDSGKDYKTVTVDGATAYEYAVTRDLDGTGRDAWNKGDGVFNTGAIGSQFIDLTAQNSLTTGASIGGAALTVFERTGAVYSDISPRLRLGELNGSYGYSVSAKGLAAGDYASTWFAIDNSNGLRFMNGATKIAEIKDGIFTGYKFRATSAPAPMSILSRSDTEKVVGFWPLSGSTTNQIDGTRSTATNETYVKVRGGEYAQDHLYIGSAESNIIDHTDNFSNWNVYGGASVTVTQNIEVPEWDTKSATRIQISGGTNVLKYYATCPVPSSSQYRSISIHIKNVGTKTLHVYSNLGSKSYHVAPGEIKKVELAGIQGDGNGGQAQIQLRSLAVGDSLDFYAWRPVMADRGHIIEYLAKGQTRPARALTLNKAPMPSKGSFVTWVRGPGAGSGGNRAIWDFSNGTGDRNDLWNDSETNAGIRWVTGPNGYEKTIVATPASTTSADVVFVAVRWDKATGVRTLYTYCPRTGTEATVADTDAATLYWNTSIVAGYQGGYLSNVAYGATALLNYALTDEEVKRLARQTAPIDTNTSSSYLDANKLVTGRVQSVTGSSYLDLNTGTMGLGSRFRYDGASLFLGNESSHHVVASGTALTFKEGGVDRGSLSGAKWRLGEVGGFTTEIETNGIYLQNNGVPYVGLDQYGVLVGNENGAHVHIADSGITMRGPGLGDLATITAAGFKFDDRMSWDGSTFLFAGWTATSSTITSGNLSLDSAGSIKNTLGAWEFKNDGSASLGYGGLNVDSSGRIRISHQQWGLLSSKQTQWRSFVGTIPTGWGFNGPSGANRIVLGTGPFGSEMALWEGDGVGGNTADSGPLSPWISIDHTRSYRFHMFMKKTVSDDGSSYFGLHSADGAENLNSVVKVSDGTTTTNPYFWSGDLPELNKWYLLVAVVHHSSASTSAPAIGGVYEVDSGKKVAELTGNYKWATSNAKARLRSYLYYSLTTAPKQYSGPMGIYEVDGTEPSVWDVMGASGSTLNSYMLASPTIKIGSGSSVFNANTSGIYLGSNTFSSAPFSVTPGGVVKATSGTIGGFTLGSTTLTSSTSRITINSGSAPYVCIKKDTTEAGGFVSMYHNSTSNWGIVGRTPTGQGGSLETIFRLGSSNVIGGWNFDANAIFTGVKQAAGGYAASSADFTIGKGFLTAKNFYIGTDGVAKFRGSPELEGGVITGTLDIRNGSNRSIVLDGVNQTITLNQYSNDTITDTFVIGTLDFGQAAGQAATTSQNIDTLNAAEAYTNGYGPPAVVTTNTEILEEHPSHTELPDTRSYTFKTTALISKSQTEYSGTVTLTLQWTFEGDNYGSPVTQTTSVNGAVLSITATPPNPATGFKLKITCTADSGFSAPPKGDYVNVSVANTQAVYTEALDFLSPSGMILSDLSNNSLMLKRDGAQVWAKEVRIGTGDLDLDRGYLNVNASGELFWKMKNNGTNIKLTTTTTALSDQRFKEDFKKIDASLLDMISGYTFRYTQDAPESAGELRHGVIAQEIEKVLPHAVSERGGVKYVEERQIIPLLIEAAKESRRHSHQLEARVSKLEWLVKSLMN